MNADVKNLFDSISNDIHTLQNDARVLGTTVQSNSCKLDSILSILSRAFPQTQEVETKPRPSLTPQPPVVRSRRNSHVTFPSSLPAADSSPAFSTNNAVIEPLSSGSGMRSSRSFSAIPSNQSNQNIISSDDTKTTGAKDDSCVHFSSYGGLKLAVDDRQKSRSMTCLDKIDKMPSDQITRAQSLKKMSCESGIVLNDELYATTDEEDDLSGFVSGAEKDKAIVGSANNTLHIRMSKEDDSSCDVKINITECSMTPQGDKTIENEEVSTTDENINIVEPEIVKSEDEGSFESETKISEAPEKESSEKENININIENDKKETTEEQKELAEASMPPAVAGLPPKIKASSVAAFDVASNSEMNASFETLKRQLSNSSTTSAPGGIHMKFGSCLPGEEEGEEEIKLPEMPPPSFTHRVVNVKMTQAKYFYDFKEQLGGGRFGRVYRCVDKKNGLNLAAKCFKCNKTRPILSNIRARSMDRPKPVKILSSKRTQQEPVEKDDVKMEINILNQIDHENIVKIYDAFEYENTMTIVMEYMAGGELFARVLSDQSPLTEFDAIIYMRQICRALQYLHKNLVIHLDLKPENILCLDRNSHHIKLIDFGLSKRYVPRQKIMVRWGTPEFMAPELLNYDVVTTASDMWSVGIICYILLSGLSPFLGNNDKETMQNIVDGDWEFDEEPFHLVSPEAKDFISRLIVEERGGRLSAAQCLKHAWLSTPMTTSRKLFLENKQQLRRFMARMHWKAGVAAVNAARWLFAKQQGSSSEENESAV